MFLTELKYTAGKLFNTMDVLSILLAIIMPPLAVFLKVGFTMHFWINVILTLLGWLPGVLHALWVLYTF